MKCSLCARDVERERERERERKREEEDRSIGYDSVLWPEGAEHD